MEGEFYTVTENSCYIVIKVSGSFSVLLFSLKLSLDWKLLCSPAVRNITALSDCLAIQHNQEHNLFTGCNLQVSINSQNAQLLLQLTRSQFFEGLYNEDFLQNQSEVEKNLISWKTLASWLFRPLAQFTLLKQKLPFSLIFLGIRIYNQNSTVQKNFFCWIRKKKPTKNQNKTTNSNLCLNSKYLSVWCKPTFACHITLPQNFLLVSERIRQAYPFPTDTITKH